MFSDHPERIRWLLSRIAPPGVEGPRKLDMLEGVRRVLARDYGQVPGWVAELEVEIHEGRL